MSVPHFVQNRNSHPTREWRLEGERMNKKKGQVFTLAPIVDASAEGNAYANDGVFYCNSVRRVQIARLAAAPAMLRSQLTTL